MGKHFILKGFTKAESFRTPSGGGSPRAIPERDRQQHGRALREQIDTLKADISARSEDAAEDVALSLQVEFEGFDNVILAFESLERERSGIELLNVRHEGGRTIATVRIPDGKLAHFEKLLLEYVSEKKNAKGGARDHRALIDTISSIRAGTVQSLWTDVAPFPTENGIAVWWEVWLPVRKKQDVLGTLRDTVGPLGILLADGELKFPERTVVHLFASPEQLRSSVSLLDCIAELRKPKETAERFDSISVGGQAELIDDLLKRTTFASSAAAVPYVCILDVGVNRGHPLLAPALDTIDVQTVDKGWGSNDTGNGHGTGLAGLALYGDLTPLLEHDTPIVLRKRLESVKIARQDSGNPGDSRHFGYITTQAIALPEITAPDRTRVFSLAMAADDNRDCGRPSAWSAAIDRLAVDAESNEKNSRLILVCAGNAADQNAYPHGNSLDSIHDPGQSWNAMTIGAYTALTKITEAGAEGHMAVAPSGALSPFSTTSMTWDKHWPLKPDLLFEGGNLAKDATGAVDAASLSLLTTSHEPTKRLFTTSNATSASTALAAGMAAEIRAAYPELRPETVRALMIQSADWTPAMRKPHLSATGRPTKSEFASLIRHCGFGVPNLVRAVESVSNSLSLVVEGVVVPFKQSGSQVTLNQMHLHELPWPKEELEALGETQVEMKVTLSYFIEPNPSTREIRSRYRYESHGLRFAVRRPLESANEFSARVNKASRDEGPYEAQSESDKAWLLGSDARHRGSLHCDIWLGSAAELANLGGVAVYPATGWWKTRQGLKRGNSAAPYSLVVSIRSPRVDVDLYAAIEQQINVPVTIAGSTRA